MVDVGAEQTAEETTQPGDRSAMDVDEDTEDAFMVLGKSHP